MPKIYIGLSRAGDLRAVSACEGPDEVPAVDPTPAGPLAPPAAVAVAAAAATGLSDETEGPAEEVPATEDPAAGAPRCERGRGLGTGAVLCLGNSCDGVGYQGAALEGPAGWVVFEGSVVGGAVEGLDFLGRCLGSDFLFLP